MLTQHIALVAEADAASAQEMARVSAALQRQVTRDLGPLWGIEATVDLFPALEAVPIGYWPVVVSREPLGAEQGVHLDRDGQPYARVEATLTWSLDASRACLEMLVDPFGNRTALGVSPRGDREAAEVLVEVCAPCAGLEHAYVINDVLVSDFCTPLYFGETAGAGPARCSFQGAVDAPMRVLPGGHLTWYAMDDDTWWIRSHHGDNSIDTRLGGLRHGASVRDLLRERAPLRPHSRRLPLSLAVRLQTQRSHAARASQLRAERLRGLFLESHVQGQLEGSTTTVALPAPDPFETAWTAAIAEEPRTAAKLVPEAEEGAHETLDAAIEAAATSAQPAPSTDPQSATTTEPPITAEPELEVSAEPAREVSASEVRLLNPQPSQPPAQSTSSLPPALPGTRHVTTLRPALPPSLAEPASDAPRSVRPDSLSPRNDSSAPAQAQRSTRRAMFVASALAVAFGVGMALLLPRGEQDARSSGATAPAAAGSGAGARQVITPPKPTPTPPAVEAASMPAAAVASAPATRDGMPAPVTAAEPQPRGASPTAPRQQISAPGASRHASRPRRAVAKAAAAVTAVLPPKPVSEVSENAAAAPANAPALADLLDTRK